MAQLGFRTMDEMIGRVDCLDARQALGHWKAAGVDLSRVLCQPDVSPAAARRRVRAQDHGLEHALDHEIIRSAASALEHATPVSLHLPIRNAHRAVGTMLGYEITHRYGSRGLPEDTIRVSFEGTAGQSFGAFLPRGATLSLEGDANDYWGKGLSGGKLMVFPPRAATFVAEENVIIGNVALYGATSGEAFVRGIAGERFAVRNSGARAVVEGVGDHGCEYMTGGVVIVLGRTGRNFAAGMSGGLAFVFDAAGDFARRCNRDMVDLESLETAPDLALVRDAIQRHARYTNSGRAAAILANWDTGRLRFVKVIAKDYKRALSATASSSAQVAAQPEVHAMVARSHG
jgi:glutamate synthase (ferredoxin)